MLSSEAINNLSYELVDVVEDTIKIDLDPGPRRHADCAAGVPRLWLCPVHACVYVCGYAPVSVAQFDAKMCSDAIRKYHINYVFGVPDFFEKVYKAGYLKGVDMSTMKLIGPAAMWCLTP